MISPVSNAHTGNAQQAAQNHSPKAVPQAQTEQKKNALPEDTVTLNSTGKSGAPQQNNG